MRNSFKNWSATIIYINEDISTKAMFLVEQYFLSHSIQLADALIGATSMIYGLPLLTANTNHYKIIRKIILKKFSPYSIFTPPAPLRSVECLPNLSSLPNEILVVFYFIGVKCLPRLPNEMRSQFHRGGARLSGVKSLLHLFLWGELLGIALLFNRDEISVALISSGR